MTRNSTGTSRARMVKLPLRELGLRTVCEEARCPNQRACFGRRTATFLILGDVCTRNCGFCAVSTGSPEPPDAGEPDRVAAGAERLGLRFAVVTSVTRDDLPDGGAAHFVATASALRRRLPGIGVEFLTPDFGGRFDAADLVLETGPDVFNHNVETVPRLYGAVRPQASYERSLALLAHAAKRGKSRVKSGIMVGFGESPEEVTAVLRDLRDAGCSLVTIGQYLRPRRENIPVHEYVHPEQFGRYAETARRLGFKAVASAPLVRSSMDAEELSNV